MRIAIIGAGGQLGRAIVAVLGREHDVVAWTRADVDVVDAEAVATAVNAIRPDAIVNASAWTDVDGCETDPARATAIHVEGARAVSHAATRAQALLVHVSTDFVFDGTLGRPYTEDDAPNPLQVYGRTKLEAEAVVQASRGRSCVMRTSWLYDLDAPQGFVAAILTAAKRGEPLPVVADQVGSPTTTTEAARAIGDLIEHRMEGVVHRAGGDALSRAAFARRILETAGLDPALVVDVQSGDVPARAAVRPANTSLATVRPTLHRGPAGAADGCEC